MGNNSFAPWSTNPETFTVQNIAPSKKTIFIFNYPINYNTTRDLLKIPGVAEDNIRASLLKGELQHKIKAREIIILSSDINLLQFNDIQRSFLTNAGVTTGLQISNNQMEFIQLENIQLIGAVNGINNIFTILSGKYIQNQTYQIIVYLNGIRQVLSDDYLIAESGGPGTGYDTVIFTTPPESAISPSDVVTADYYIVNGV